MAKRSLNDLTPGQVAAARRRVRRTLRFAGLSYVLVAGVAFWLGLPVVGIGLIVVGAMGLPLAKRSMDRKLDERLD